VKPFVKFAAIAALSTSLVLPAMAQQTGAAGASANGAKTDHSVGEPVTTDSSGIPFGVSASSAGTPQGKPASAFTDPASPLYLPVTVDGQAITPQTNAGRLQSTSKLAAAPVPVPGQATEGAASGKPGHEDPEIARGRYLTAAADCVVCHTAAGGKPFAGGLPFKTPFGTMYSSNITPDEANGIGAWTAEDFIGAVRHGKSKDGANLYPSMPYTSYVKMTDGDARAIYAYLKTVSAVNQTPPANEMGFPYNQRWALTFWNLLNFKDTGFSPDPSKSDAYNRGAYVAVALGHCEECHTPRDIGMGLVESQSYAGASIDGWRAFDISSSKSGGIGSWSEQEIVQYLTAGALPGKATAAGPMADVISHSTRFMSAEDLSALALYLHAQPARGSDSKSDRFSQGRATDDLTAEVRGKSYGDAPNGAVLYNGNCASCHGVDGAGIGASLYYPSLFHNSATGAEDPSNLIQVILNGVDRTDAQGRSIVMPAFAGQMTSSEIVTLANYVTKNFGAANVVVTADQVDQLRTNAVTVIPGWILVSAGVALAIVALVILGLLFGRYRRSGGALAESR
jgi:mono/diheme cytochrome c family protein